ncbi:hypothetical protein GCM10007893_02330 [Paracoccus marinus]|nr:hypothetical protein GCM10007893_02330 [Paracoccus marinus]
MRADFHSGDGLRQSLRIEHHQDPSARIGVGMSIVIRSVRVIGGRAPDRQQQIPSGVRSTLCGDTPTSTVSTEPVPRSMALIELPPSLAE